MGTQKYEKSLISLGAKALDIDQAEGATAYTIYVAALSAEMQNRFLVEYNPRIEKPVDRLGLNPERCSEIARSTSINEPNLYNGMGSRRIVISTELTL